MKGEIYTKMLENNNQFILKEGYSKIAIAITITLILFFFGFSFLSKVGVLITLFLLWIYKNNLSESYNPQNLEESIYAPIDGKISSIDYSKDSCKVYIDVRLWDNHILRAPVNGNFSVDLLINGLNLSGWTYKSKLLNTRASMSFVDSGGEVIKLNAICGFFAPKIVLESDKKEVKTSEKIGLFVHGIVILEIPKSYELKLKLNDKVMSGISVIAGKIE